MADASDPSDVPGHPPPESTGSKTVGLVLFWIGVAFLVLLGFLSSWWFVPAIRETGLDELTAPGVLTFFWSIAAPIGAILAAIGGSLYARAERRLTGLLILGSAGVVVLSMAWPVRQVVPALYGIDGGLITLFFVGLVWNWARSRPNLEGDGRLASDLSMIGHVFFLFAAWYLCGLLGAPTFALRPELMAKYGTAASAASLGSLISVYLVLGWCFTFLGHRTALRAATR